MQDLLHGVMGLIGMGHLQVREGRQKARGRRRESEGESVKKEEEEEEGMRGRKERKSEMSSSVDNMEQAF